MGARADLRVERRALMRVLAVGQVDDLLEGAHVQRREVLALLGEPAADRDVVARRVGERLGGQRLARGHAQQALGLAQLVEHGVVALGVHHDGAEGVVLGRRADHRRAADVDVLDHLGLVGPHARRRALERIEVDEHEVDELDLVLAGRPHVVGVVARGEQPGVELGVQRLDPAVHDLREAGEVVDAAHRDAAALERLRGAAGRDHLDAELGESGREVDDAALVGDRQQRAPDPDGARLRECPGGRVLGDAPEHRGAGCVRAPSRGNTRRYAAKSRPEVRAWNRARGPTPNTSSSARATSSRSASTSSTTTSARPRSRPRRVARSRIRSRTPPATSRTPTTTRAGRTPSGFDDPEADEEEEED